MISLRDNPLKEIGGEKVVLVEDYLSSEDINSSTDSSEIQRLDIPKSNVLIYYTENGTKVAARPSGTEPKIKFYFSVNGSLDKPENYDQVSTELSEKISEIKSELKLA